jgi:hypothetical protein
MRQLGRIYGVFDNEGRKEHAEGLTEEITGQNFG